MNTYIPEGYKSLLGVYDTQKAIGLLKRLFEDQLAANLNLFQKRLYLAVHFLFQIFFCNTLHSAGIIFL